MSESELAHEFGLVTDDPTRPRWKELLSARVREAIIFQGDSTTYGMAKRASDGIEHGIWGLDEMSKLAVDSAEKTYRYIRESILGLMGVTGDVAQDVAAITPRDVSSIRRIVRGRLVGMAEDPAMEGELYPHLRWSWDVQSVEREGATFRTRQTERFTVRTHADIGFIPDRYEVIGRLEPGEEMVQYSDDALSIDPPGAGTAERLLGEVMPLVDAAIVGSEEHQRTQAEVYVFEMHGQAVAYFQAISVILGADQPVEALPLLGGLIALAGRFEQMTDPAGAGVGIAIRDAVNSIANIGAEVDVEEAAIRRVLQRAEADGIRVPDAIDDPSSTSIHASLAAEAKMAASVASGPYGAAVLHTSRTGDGRAEFHVAGRQGSLYDLVASASVIAMLEVLAAASELLSFSADMDRLADVLGAARVANELAAGSLSGSR